MHDHKSSISSVDMYRKSGCAMHDKTDDLLIISIKRLTKCSESKYID